MDGIFQERGAGYIAAVLGIAAVTAICAPFHDQLNHTTVALASLLVVLFVATVWGSWPALIASVLGMLCFNFFFLPVLRKNSICASLTKLGEGSRAMA